MPQVSDTVWLIEVDGEKYYEENANGDFTLGCQDVMGAKYFISKTSCEDRIKELIETFAPLEDLRPTQMRYKFGWDFIR